MPATEQTWYSMKVLHVVFGVSALVMTLASIWMIANDYNREWKSWTLADRKKEAWMLTAQLDAKTDQYASQTAQLLQDLLEARSQPIEKNQIEQFESWVNSENSRLDRLGMKFKKKDFGDLEKAYEAFQDASGDVQEMQRAIARQAKSAGDASEKDQGVSGANRPESAKQRMVAGPAAAAGPGADRAHEPFGDLKAAQDNAAAARAKLFDAMGEFISEARRRQKMLEDQKKFVNADRTAAVSKLGLLVEAGASQQEQDAAQGQIDQLDQHLEDLTDKIANSITYLDGLVALQTGMDKKAKALTKKLGAMQTELKRLHDQIYLNTSNLGEWIARRPILNALYNGNVKINQIWLPDLTINYNFTQAARFDRCKSCHRAISQTATGTPTDPAYPTIPKEQRELVLTLDTPTSPPNAVSSTIPSSEEQPAGEPAREGTLDNREKLKRAYGFVLADQGIVNYEDVTVRFVVPDSPAAQAGLESGDVLLQVGDMPMHAPTQVAGVLLQNVTWGAPVSLTIRRGLDHPFTTHPRLDLYLTDLSPHPEKIFGCTECHDGQGSGTAFKWTSHTPDNADQQQQWRRKYGWFDNHNWIFPMKPHRFIESNCMKCHYNKAELEASERFPNPPAPQLVKGWTLVERYGCFGCHQINGFDGPNRRVGPDLRLEPNYHETAAQILRDQGLNKAERGWASRLVHTPDDGPARRQLMASVQQDATASPGRLMENTHKLASALKDVEIPGQYRKVGPSLRHLKSKVDFDWLYSWINKPTDFRPTTRMPQYFHQFEHLDEPEDADQRAVSERFEPIEVRALAEYLLANSSDFEYLKPPAEVTEPASAERGQWLFESRGCLACHAHEKFPGIASIQGPDLSRLSAKFNTEKGRQWVYSWIKQPHRYSSRTRMPRLFLDPIVEKDAQGKPTGKVTDPAADIRAFLLGVPTDWRPTGVPSRQMTADDEQALADLASEWLTSETIPPEEAKKFIHDGIPARLASKIKSVARPLLDINDQNRVSKQLEYVARETIGKYGCFGCHDIPGFEDARSIGTGLADWGRKESSRLAFENIHKFLETHGVEAPGRAHPENSGAGPGNSHGTAGPDKAGPDKAGSDKAGGHGGAWANLDHTVRHGHLDPLDFNADESYFVQAIDSHNREGFLWQKLRLPRSYDYKKTRNEGYNERLRMPRFPLNDAQREAIMTFVLGLVHEPPAEQFVYHPDPRQEAIIQGKQVLDKFHCAGCHTLRMERWDFGFTEDTFESPPEVVDYPFLETQFDEKKIAASKQLDSRGLLHTSVHGLSVRSEETGAAVRFDEDGLPLEEDDDESAPYYLFTLWQNALIQGETWPRGVQDLLIPARPDGYGPAHGTAYPAKGGDLTRYLFPKVIAHAKQANPQAKGVEAWGWLPPSLMEEGAKVQPDWLHGFLMDPFAIRPAVVMRMPNFQMSSEDATKLTNYFAATAGAQFPYEFRRQQRLSYLTAKESHAPDRLQEAMRVVTNGNYCVKCHTVADFHPQGEQATLGPNLAGVTSRLRPDYVRKWIANPKRVLPYTGMPVNIPYDPDKPHLGGISQDLISGTSIQQLDGLVDLLMNFDLYTQRQTSIQSLVQSGAKSGEATDKPQEQDK